MSDVNAVHTAVTRNTSGNNPNSAATDKSAKGVNFYDLMNTKKAADKANIAIQDDSDNQTSIAFDLNGQGTTTQLDADGLKSLKAALDSLVQGLPADQRPVVVKLSTAQLQKIVDKLTAAEGDITDKQQSLIATGLTPDQLTKLADFLNQGDAAQLNDDGLKAVLVGILKLVPDGDKTKTIFFPKTLIAAKTAADKAKDEKSDDDLASSLNALCVGSATQNTTPLTSGGTTAALESGDASTLNSNGEKKVAGGFNEVLKLLEQIQAKQAGFAAPSDLAPAKAADADVAAQPGPVNSTTAASFDDVMGSLSSDGGFDTIFPDGLGWSKDNQYGLSNVQAAGPAQLTSLVTNAPSATQSHPATQVVAATLARTFEGGETKNLTLRLDPPELGKIEIQMQFTKDKSVKTHMVFEKPETMLMMQRDSHTLERAMQNAGMDAGGNSLSFELGGQDNAFTGGQSGNSSNSSGNQNSGTENASVIETTMSWSVDAETGQYHYNVLA